VVVLADVLARDRAVRALIAGDSNTSLSLSEGGGSVLESRTLALLANKLPRPGVEGIPVMGGTGPSNFVFLCALTDRLRLGDRLLGDVGVGGPERAEGGLLGQEDSGEDGASDNSTESDFGDCDAGGVGNWKRSITRGAAGCQLKWSAL
jgi:hypothetical protein